MHWWQRKFKTVIKNNRSKLQLIGWLLGGGLLIYQLIQGIISYQQHYFQFHNVKGVITALACSILALVLQMLSWKMFMKDLGVDIPWLAVFKGYFLSFLPRYIPGTIWGYISRGEWLYQQFRVDYSITNVGSILELGSAIFANMMILAFHFTKKSISARWWLVIFPFLTIIAWLVFKEILKFLKGKKIEFWGTIEKFLSIKTKTWFECTILFGITWILYGISLFFIQSSLMAKVVIDVESITSLTEIYSMAWMMGFIIIFIPAGLGLREFALMNLLQNYTHMSKVDANVTAVVGRIVIVIAEICLLLFGFLLSLNHVLHSQRKNTSKGLL